MVYFLLLLNPVVFNYVYLLGNGHLALKVQGFILNQIRSVFLKLVGLLQQGAPLGNVNVFSILVAG